MNQDNNSHAIFVLASDGLTWARRSAVNDDRRKLIRFISDTEELRYLPPQNVVVVNGDRDRYLANLCIPHDVFGGLVRSGELKVVD